DGDPGDTSAHREPVSPEALCFIPKRFSEARRVAVLAGVGATDERFALDEDRLPAAEAVRVRLAHGPVAELVQLLVSLPEAFLQPDVLAVDPEAGSVERSLRIEPVVDERGDELHVRLRLDEAAHHAERPEQLAAAQQKAGDDRVVRPPPRLDGSADREACAAALEDDARARRDGHGAEPVEQALDERDGHAVAVDGAEVDGAAGGLGNGSLLPAPPPLEIDRVNQLADIRAVANACEPVFQRELRAAHAAAQRRRRALEQPASLERDDPLRGRRQLSDLRAPTPG